ncbi:MAG: hypothetical protein JWN96_1671 [Mycobacterium sp.]|nr:hypothetical protein [Mycobacterium sp.]
MLPQPQQPAEGGFDWLIESHQQSAPLAALTDDVPSPLRAQPAFDFPFPAVPSTGQQPVFQQPPQATIALLASAPPPAVASPPAPAAPSSFSSQSAVGAFALERHQSHPRSGNGTLDWVAFALAFLAPPIGLLVGIGAVVSDSRGKGYVASVAKAAIGVGAGLSLVLGVVVVVVGKIDSDHAAHDAIVASSRTYCSKLESNPATLASNTFGWPAPGDTIAASIQPIKAYDSTWKSLISVAPQGIRVDTKKVEAAAAGILASVQSTQTLDDASNVSQMQDVVAATGIRAWVSTYCQ